MKKYKKTATAIVSGRASKELDNPLTSGIIHHKLGVLSWELDNGTIVVCRSYHEYKKNEQN